MSTCATCGTAICLGEAQERDLRRSHQSFFCPMGHSNYYPGKTEDQRRIEQLEARVDRFRELWETTRAALGHCPWPECRWRSHAHQSRVTRYIWRHMLKAHSIDHDAKGRLRVAV